MPFIKPVSEEEASGRVAELYEAKKGGRGYVPNYLSLFALRPDVYDAGPRLIGSIRANMDLRRYELATLAAAQALTSSYCSLAHGIEPLRRRGFSEEEIFEVVLAAAAWAFFSKTVDGRGTKADREYRDLLGAELFDRWPWDARSKNEDRAILFHAPRPLGKERFG